MGFQFHIPSGICITFQNLLCKTWYHIPDKRTVVLFRILTFIKWKWNDSRVLLQELDFV